MRSVTSIARRAHVLQLAGLTGALLLAPAVAGASGLGAISNADAVGALRQALSKGADAAIAQLGREGGFQNDPKVRIPLPDALQKSEKLLRFAGKGEDLDRLQVAMNRAAEMAVPRSRELMSQAIKSMSVDDAKKILGGGDDSVTRFFRDKTSAALHKDFLPIVGQQVKKLDLAQQYNALAGQGSKLGLVKGDAQTVEGFVTAKALDGLYTMIAEQERALRANPMQAGSQLLGKVFGALK